MADPELFVIAAPNWGRSVTLGVQFKTKIFKSRLGYETRSALKEFPSVALEYGVTAARKGSPASRQFFARRLAEDVIFPDLLLKTSATSTGVTTVSGDVDDHRFAVGERVFIEGELSGHQSGIVQTNDKAEIVLDSSVEMVPGESVKLYPGLSGRLEGGLKSRMSTSSAAGFNVALKAHNDQGRIKDLVTWTPNQWYRDRPVALWAPNWRDSVSEDWSRDQFSMDIDYATPFYKAKRKHPERASNHTTLLRTPDEAAEIVSFFCFCRGRQKSFYAPTWVDDFLFEMPVTVGQTEIKVFGQDALDLYSRGGVFQSIAIRKGSIFHLSGILDFRADGRDSVVTLSDPIPASVAGADRASWLLRQRFNSDQIEFEYVTDSVSEVEVKMVSVLEDYPAIRVDNIEIVIDGKFITLGSGREVLPSDQGIRSDGFQISINGDYLT